MPPTGCGEPPTSFANAVFGIPLDGCQGTGDGNNYAPNVAICYIAMSRVRGPLAPDFNIDAQNSRSTCRV